MDEWAGSDIEAFLVIWDIVGYSRLSNAEQTRQVSAFNKLIAKTFDESTLFTGTGDGGIVALATSSHVVTDVLDLVLHMYREWNPDIAAIRVALNVGKISTITNPKGSIDFTGEGVNTAARVCSVSKGRHVLASDRFVTNLRQVQPQRANLFEDLGLFTISGRSYHIYNLHHESSIGEPWKSQGDPEPEPPLRREVDAVGDRDANVTASSSPDLEAIAKKVTKLEVSEDDLVAEMKSVRLTRLLVIGVALIAVSALTIALWKRDGGSSKSTTERSAAEDRDRIAVLREASAGNTKIGDAASFCASPYFSLEDHEVSKKQAAATECGEHLAAFSRDSTNADHSPWLHLAIVDDPSLAIDFPQLKDKLATQLLWLTHVEDDAKSIGRLGREGIDRREERYVRKLNDLAIFVYETETAINEAERAITKKSESPAGMAHESAE